MRSRRGPAVNLMSISAATAPDGVISWLLIVISPAEPECSSAFVQLRLSCSAVIFARRWGASRA